MQTTHLVASELFFVLVLAGCANLPMDQACRAGLESEFKLLDADDDQIRYHRSPDFVSLLYEAEDDELAGDYQSCLSNLKMARNHRHEYIAHNRYFSLTQNTYSRAGQNQSNRGSANDAAHHAAGHTHHHGHN